MFTVIGCSWESGTITGTLVEKGWGAEMGFPGITLSEHGDKIKGFIFSSENFSKHWARLDSEIKNGSTTVTYVYTLK